MSAADEAPRPGTTLDLSRRMDRMEQRQDNIETEVRTLAATVGRVEQNQAHASELNRLRFDALDTGLKQVVADLSGFMKRIESIVAGETETAQTRAGAELVADYQAWRKGVETRLDGHDKFETQGRLLGRLGVLLVTTNVGAIILAIAALVQQKTP